MKTSLIVSTYNRPDALELCLLSAFAQSDLPDEIIVADDGSGDDTADIVRGLSARARPLVHVRQEHQGFRAARIRNKAIARATGEYIILVDGDMALHRDFVADHKRFARPGAFTQGGRVLLTAEKTAEVLHTKQLRFSPWESGLQNRKNTLHSGVLSWFASGRRRTMKGIRTCNFALWMEDVLSVNGFNEDFEGWGREDSEFALRLKHRGVRGRDIRFGAIAFHLHHPPQSRDSLSKNDALLASTGEQRLAWCKNGLGKWLGGE